jgi:tRNA nucleotidyltransferase (CCA-adding enzyme)
MNTNINIPREVETALNILNNNNYQAYVVGGCVRDSLLDVVPNDWDITTSAKPEDINKCFDGYRTINTGLKHGTITVLINGMSLEITTFRVDGKYSDNRRPDSVLFTNDVSNDLKRRDFTINSLAYNKNGIVDLFGGISDIYNKVIKCVGEPDERFNEDGLRILRAMRFSSVLDFKIDEKTSISIIKNKQLLKNISKERISAEFSKLVKGKNYFKVMMEYKEVIEEFIPEIKSLGNTEWENILISMTYADDLVLKLCLLLNETNNAESILKNLKYDGTTIRDVKLIVSYKDEKILDNKIIIKKQLKILGYEYYVNLLKFKHALLHSQSIRYEQELKRIESTQIILNQIIMNNECYNLKMLEVNGEDLIRVGFSKGIYLGLILDELLDLVIEEKLENKKEILINYVKKYRKDIK